jgi:hypothetical protein
MKGKEQFRMQTLMNKIRGKFTKDRGSGIKNTKRDKREF